MTRRLHFPPLLVVFLFAALSQAKLLTVHLSEDPLVWTKAFKDVHKEVLTRRSINPSSERNVPLSKAIAKNKELSFQAERVKSQQESFISSLPGQWKVAEILRENGKKERAVSHIASNSVVIDIGDSDASEAVRTLMAISGVSKVDREPKLVPDTFQALDQIGATSVYETLGMSELDIGKGIKIAVIDSGNYVGTRMMDDEGFSLPLDLPSNRGEEANVNNKLIVSRSYGSYNTSYPAANETCHGIHTSSTAGGRRVNVTLKGHNYTLSGVAPGAWLMNYRYIGATGASIGKVVDNVIEDNPDISSNSWGPSYPIYNSELSTYQNLERLVDNGVFVSKSAGNDGPQQLTLSASLENSLVVGACTKDDISYYSLEVPSMNKTYECKATKETNVLKDFYTATIIDDEEYDGCNSSHELTFSEDTAVVLVSWGCNNDVKAENMKNYGAGIMIIGKNSLNFDCETTELPSLYCSYDDVVRDIILHIMANGDVRININRIKENETAQDKVADFSSRGPTPDMKLVPDVVAPGVGVLAAGYGDGEDPRLGFNFVSGTSMAAPFVSGAAAIILQKHPEFTTEEVKSALMTTADFVNVTREEDDEPAQPLDMGAGRINLERAINPVLYISPPKVDFSLAQKPEEYARTVKVSSYSDEELTISVRIVRHTGRNEVTPAEDYLSADPNEFVLTSASPVDVSISLNTSAAELGDENAYVLFVDKNSGEEVAHIPLWGQVICPESEKKDVLLVVIDPDYCNKSATSNVVDVYADTMNKTGLSYDLYDCCSDESNDLFVKAFGLGYRAVIFAVSMDVCWDVFSDLESQVRRMMHAGVPVIQMGKDLDIAWRFSEFVMGCEFGIDVDYTDFINPFCYKSEYFVGCTHLPEYVTFIVDDHKTLLETETGKPFVVSAKDALSGYDGMKIVNSVGITSFVGLEEFKEKYRKGIILAMYWHGVEKKSDIKRDFNISGRTVTYDIATLTNYSEVTMIEYRCGSDYGKKITNYPYFKCKYSRYGVYEVKYYVYTSVNNVYYFNETVNVAEPPKPPVTVPSSSSSSSFLTPSPKPETSSSSSSPTYASSYVVSPSSSSSTPSSPYSSASPQSPSGHYGSGSFSYTSYLTPHAFLMALISLLITLYL